MSETTAIRVISYARVSTGAQAASLMRNVVGAFNEYERLLICERTKAALAIARSQGKRLGRPSRQSQQAKELATELRAGGLSLRKIGAALAEAGLRTPTGKPIWSASSVQGLLRTAHLDQEAAANAAAMLALTQLTACAAAGTSRGPSASTQAKQQCRQTQP